MDLDMDDIPDPMMDAEDALMDKQMELEEKIPENPMNGFSKEFNDRVDEITGKFELPTENYFTGFIIKMCCFVSLSGFLFGYNVGVIAGVELYFKDEYDDISTQWRENIVAFVFLGQFVGSLASGPLADLCGRRLLILLADGILVFGILLIAFTTDLYSLVAGRFIIGIGAGITQVIVPLYISEMVPIKMIRFCNEVYRITLACSQVFGIAISIPYRHSWRLLLILSAIPTIIQMILLIFIPQSPRYLISVEEEDECKAVLEEIYNKPEEVTK